MSRRRLRSSLLSGPVRTASAIVGTSTRALSAFAVVGLLGCSSTPPDTVDKEQWIRYTEGSYVETADLVRSDGIGFSEAAMMASFDDNVLTLSDCSTPEIECLEANFLIIIVPKAPQGVASTFQFASATVRVDPGRAEFQRKTHNVENYKVTSGGVSTEYVYLRGVGVIEICPHTERFPSCLTLHEKESGLLGG